ncbi:hypothetical protein Tco_0677134 [Tanacetum coccineum]
MGRFLRIAMVEDRLQRLTCFLDSNDLVVVLFTNFPKLIFGKVPRISVECLFAPLTGRVLDCGMARVGLDLPESPAKKRGTVSLTAGGVSRDGVRVRGNEAIVVRSTSMMLPAFVAWLPRLSLSSSVIPIRNVDWYMFRGDVRSSGSRAPCGRVQAMLPADRFMSGRLRFLWALGLSPLLAVSKSSYEKLRTQKMQKFLIQAKSSFDLSNAFTYVAVLTTGHDIVKHILNFSSSFTVSIKTVHGGEYGHRSSIGLGQWMDCDVDLELIQVMGR